MSMLTDEQLIKNYLIGDNKALELLIKRYLTPIYNFVLRYVKNTSEAEDVTQEVFVKVWKNLKKFNDNYKFKSWLYTIAKNTSLDYLKKKKKNEFKPRLPPRPAEEIAIEALKALKEMKLAEKGMFKEYYIRLSDIIRIYIENRYRIFAMDRTTWELFQEMRSKKIERLHVDKINDFLEGCDMVKFAKYTPGQKEMEEAYVKAEDIINITTPKIIT